MNLSISQKATMTSIEIAELVGKRPDNVKRTIEHLAERGVISFPQIEEKPTAGRPAGGPLARTGECPGTVKIKSRNPG